MQIEEGCTFGLKHLADMKQIPVYDLVPHHFEHGRQLLRRVAELSRHATTIDLQDT